MELLIVSGLSGAGKSVAMNALEDIGYFCIDNIPAALLPSITAFSKAGDNQLDRVALCMDVRGCRTREEIEQALQQLDEKEDGTVLDFRKLLKQDIRRSRRIIRQRKAIKAVTGILVIGALVILAAFFITGPLTYPPVPIAISGLNSFIIFLAFDPADAR